MDTMDATDIVVQDEGSICIVYPRTPDAETWCAEHLPEDVMCWGTGFVVERNYLPDILDGMRADGLEVA